MDDHSILHRIQHLVDEEHRLDDQKSHSPEDHERHRALQVLRLEWVTRTISCLFILRFLLTAVFTGCDTADWAE